MDERLQRRRARRQARFEAEAPLLKEALQDVYGHPYPGVEATRLVQEVLAQFDIPARLTVRHMRAHRAEAHGNHGVTEGRIDVLVTVRPRVGPATELVVPVMVHQGQLLTPSVGVSGGQVFLLAQSTFDNLIKQTSVPEHRLQKEDEAAHTRNIWNLTASLAHDVDVADATGSLRRLTAGTSVTTVGELDGGILVRLSDGTRAILDATDLV